MLARHGRGDEAFALLRPHIEDRFLAAALVDVSAGVGRDEEYAATEYLGHAAQRLAEVLEERGDVEGAIAALR